MYDGIQDTTDSGEPDGVVNASEQEGQSPSEEALVKKIQERIQQDCTHHKTAFDRMRRDMYVARHGKLKTDTNAYTANLIGRHIRRQVAALYAKNPKAIARRRDTLDFAVWDEKPDSLQMAMQTLMMAQQLTQQVVQTGGILYEADPQVQQIMQAAEQAQATVADFRAGMERRQAVNRIGRTLEILFKQALREQKPVDFKTGMKQLVRRTCTTGVGYVELAFQRETGPRPGLESELADFRTRLDHLKAMADRVGDIEDPVDSDDPEIAELEKAIAALQTEQEVIIREGLVIDFPQATRVIPDKLTKNIVGFVGARHLTIEYMYTLDQVQTIFGTDLGKQYNGYSLDGKPTNPDKNPATVEPDDIRDDETFSSAPKGTGLCRVWKHYDKQTGLVYYCAEGHKKWLRDPAKPDVYVEDFWPVYALTFNNVEDEKELFPPSDVELLLDMQQEYNESRSGMKAHKKAARPKWAYSNGKLDDVDQKSLASLGDFESVGLNMAPNEKIADVLMPIPIPGVDPNLYETGPILQDMQLIAGTNESQMGGLAKATATESAIAAGAVASTDGSAIDDLDGFLSTVVRAAGQIMMREFSEEIVTQVVGPGAVWPPMTLGEIANELYLEVEAGSTGKPNQAVEIDNWKTLLPLLLQMPEVNKTWLARETIRRLDDRADLTEAISEGAPSIMALNKLQQMSTGDPATDPNQQADQGANNAERPAEKQPGSDAAFGSNQV